MLAYILAIAIGLASLILFLIAFFSPPIHRQDDFLWSGVGLFYALVLWVCGGRITGGVLLGQAAATSLLLVFGWQTLKLRRTIAYPEQQAKLEEFSLMGWIGRRLGKTSPPPQPETVPTTPQPEAEAASETETIVEETPQATSGEESQATTETEAETVPPEAARVPETVTVVEETEETLAETEEVGPISPATETETETEAVVGEEETTLVGAEKEEKPEKAGFSLKNLFSFGKSQPEDRPETITEALAAVEAEDNKEELEEDKELTEIPEALATEEKVESSTIEATSAESGEELDLEVRETAAEEVKESPVEESQLTTESSQSQVTLDRQDQEKTEEPS